MNPATPQGGAKPQNRAPKGPPREAGRLEGYQVGQDTLQSLSLDLCLHRVPRPLLIGEAPRRAGCMADHPQRCSREGLLRLHRAPENRSLPVQGTRLALSKQIKAWCWKAGVWEWIPPSRGLRFLLEASSLRPALWGAGASLPTSNPTGGSNRVCGRLTVAADDPSPGRGVPNSVCPHPHT